MPDVAVVSFAQATYAETRRNEPELLLPVLDEAVAAVGLTRQDIGFTCSGSTDYLAGQPFSFVAALDAVGAWPPIAESHVEMDGAWALYEAWLWLSSGHADTALVYAFGKTSPSDLNRTLALQLDQVLYAQLLLIVAFIAILKWRGRRLTELAREWGRTDADGRSPLRQVLYHQGRPDDDVPREHRYNARKEHHDLGAVLVAAIFEALSRVFDRFTQGDSSTTREHSGVGLGLAIARDLVELHGGSVRAENRPEAEMDALFREQMAHDTALLGKSPYAGKVGAFEGANYEARGYFRPEVDCIMFTRDQVPFCAVCRRAIERVLDLYTAR